MSLSGIWTAKGIDKLAAQTAGGPTLTIHKIALGDGGGIVPAVLPSQVALLKEVWRGLVNAVLVEQDTPNVVTVEAVIPYSVGGFYIREWGIYDTDGDLLAVGPHAEFYKPLLAEGSGAELLERIQLPLANAGQVNLTISSEALATRKYVDQTATAKAKEEVARHDGDVTAHGAVAEELEHHINDIDNPHQTPLPPLAQLKRPGLMCPDGCTGIVNASGVLSVLPGAQWRGVVDYSQPVVVLGLDNKVYIWRAPSGPNVADVGVKQPGAEGSDVYWLDYAASITPPPMPPYPIGIPMEWRSITLGKNMVWADRGAIYFEDWPEFKAIYDAGDFAGMVLPASAAIAEQQTYLGKWVLLPDGTGLLTPDRRGQFVRGWGPGQTVDAGREAGSWQSDEFKSHSHNYYIGGMYTNAAPGDARTEVTGMTNSTSNTGGSETRPRNLAVPVGIYMGLPA